MSQAVVAYLTKDLIFSSSLSAIAREEEIDLRIVLSEKQARELAQSEPVTGLLVDLEMTPLDLPTLLAELPNRSRTIVMAYGPHVHEARLEMARAAGCDRVLIRGQLNRSMADLLRQLAGR